MKIVKIILSCLLIVVIMNSSFTSIAYASEVKDVEVVELETTVRKYVAESAISARSTTFVDASIDISYSSAGMYVVITTSVNGIASVLGAKDIEVQMQDGDDWITVATSSGGEVSDASGCTISFTYTGAVYGETYRVVCTHYGNVDEYRELYHETVGFKCIY